MYFVLFKPNIDILDFQLGYSVVYVPAYAADSLPPTPGSIAPLEVLQLKDREDENQDAETHRKRRTYLTT